MISQSARCNKFLSTIVAGVLVGGVARVDLVGFESKFVVEGPAADFAAQLR